MEVASRALQDGERRLDALDLIKEGFNLCSSEFRVYSSLTRQTDQDSPISRSLASNFNLCNHNPTSTLTLTLTPTLPLPLTLTRRALTSRASFGQPALHDSHARRLRDAGSLTTQTQIYLSARHEQGRTCGDGPAQGRWARIQLLRAFTQVGRSGMRSAAPAG
eukprot:scaffold15891_cov48-Phaeocystis_antarctica.AAC.2